MSRSLPLLLLSLCLLSGASFAQSRSGAGAPHGGIGMSHPQTMTVPGGGAHASAPQIFHGGPRTQMPWTAFHHDTAPARVAPHRFGNTNLPRASNWHGSMNDFDLHAWQGGSWRHALHDGRLGWWWTVGPDWYYFNEPVYPYPDLYTPFGEPIGWWYWCDPSQEYYPYISYCPVPWESVMPRE